MPCTKRPASMNSMEFAVADAIAPTANRVMPPYSTGSRPTRSDTRPAGICPNAIPIMKMPTIFWPRDRLVESASTIAGTAGRLTSTVNAASSVMRPSVTTKLRFSMGEGGFTIDSD